MWHFVFAAVRFSFVNTPVVGENFRASFGFEKKNEVLSLFFFLNRIGLSLIHFTSVILSKFLLGFG